MRARMAVIGAAALLWVGLMAASVLVPPMIAPTGEGFTRGVNRLALLALFQLLAAVLAIFLLVLSGAEAHRGRRWLMRVPILWVAGLVLFFLGLILWIRLVAPG